MKNSIGTIIGAILVNKPFVDHYKQYECAAWWEDRQAVPGVYPVLLKRNHLFPHYYYAEAQVAGKVVDDYFQGFWCGMPIGKTPYKPKHIGEDRLIPIKKDLVEAIKVTGQTPDSDVCWYIDQSWWSLALEEAQKELQEAYTRLPQYWNEYQKGDDEYDSRVRMVGYFGRLMEKSSKEIEIINRMYRYSKQKMFRKLHEQNTTWVNIEIQKRGM